MSQAPSSTGRSLVTADAVVVHALDDVVLDAAVLIEDGRVVGVGPLPALRRQAPLAPVRELTGRVLLPGLIDAHSHLRGLPTCAHDIADGPLEHWVVRLAAMAPVDPRADALAAAVDAVTTGVTTAQVLHHTFADEDGYLDALTAAVDALTTAGLNAEVVLGLTDQAEFVPSALEAELTAEQRRWLVPDRGVPASGFDALVARAEQRIPSSDDVPTTGPWLRLGVAPVGPQWASDALLATIARHAGPQRRVHTHAVETRAQRTWGPDSPIDRLERHGLLTAATSLAHAVHLTDPELARLAAAGVAVATCPTSNARVSDGTGDLPRWQRAGIEVALGLDSVGHPDRPDAFAELRALRATAQRRGGELSAPQALAIATVGGAAAVGRQDRIGSLAPGAAADLIAVRTPTGWRPGGGRCLIDALLATATRGDVTDVYLGGEAVVVDGRHRAAEAVRDVRATLASTLRATQAERAERRAQLAALEPLIERIRLERSVLDRGQPDRDEPAG